MKTSTKPIDNLLYYLLDEAKDNHIPNHILYKDKMHLLKALMCMRPPKSMPSDLLEIQDMMLQSLNGNKTIVDSDNLDTISTSLKEFKFPFGDKIVLWKGDIRTLKVDAIVNSANAKLLGCFLPHHACVDNAIHSSAGVQLRLECFDIMQKQGFDEPAGRAKITRAYNLPSKYIIHTVGPVIQNSVTDEDLRLLASCYHSCLELAKERTDIETIAFCCISTGANRFPKDIAARLAVNSVTKWLAANHQGLSRIIFNVFTQEDYDEYLRIFKHFA